MSIDGGPDVKGKIGKIILSIALAFSTSTPILLMPDSPGFADGGEWFIETVETAGYVGYSNSLALDSGGNPHLIYNEYVGQDVHNLNYASRKDGNWSSETIDEMAYVTTPRSLAVDANDVLHVSYYDHRNNSLKYANRTDNGWSIEVVDSALYVGECASIALDSTGLPHISYCDDLHGTLKYARLAGGSWSTTTIVPTPWVNTWTSIAIDSHDRPHITYHLDDPDHDLMYIWWTGSIWKVEAVDTIGKVGVSNVLALDSNDIPHVSYSNWEFTYLKYATRSGGAWKTEAVDSSGVVGLTACLAVDSVDNPHISYDEGWQGVLKYAEWNGSDWRIEIVDSDGDVGSWSSLALDDNDLPHIGYFNSTDNDSKYATKAHLGPPPQPVLEFHPAELDFGKLVPGSIANMTFEVWNSGDGSLTYDFGPGPTWLIDVDPPNGSSTGEHDGITVTIDTTGLSINVVVHGSISIHSNGGHDYIFLRVHIVAPSHSASLNIDPDTLNLRSKGKWITAYLITENVSAHEIDPSSLLLNDVVRPAWWDVQNDTILMVKFDRSQVLGILSVGDSVRIEVDGHWKDGAGFEVFDIIRVINPGQ